MAGLTRTKVAEAGDGHQLDNVLFDADYIQTRKLAATTAEAVVCPTDSRFVVVLANVDLWIDKRGGTAAVPAADVTDGTGLIYVPARMPRIIRLASTLTLSVISDLAGIAHFEISQ